MGGIGSGRKSNSDEAKRLRIIEKAWDRIEKLIDDYGNKFGDICAKDVVTKDQRTKLDAYIRGDINVMPTIEKDGKPMEFKVGNENKP